MVICQPPGNNPSYYYRASPTLPQLLWMLPRDTLCSIHANYNIRVTHRKVLLSIFFTRIRSTEGSSADCSLFILSLHALALHLAVKYYFKSFVWRFVTAALYTSVGCISLQNASRTALCYATNTIKWKHSIFDINHQQNTRRSDQIETIKTIMQTTPSYHMEGFTNGSGCIFKEIFDQVRKDLDCECLALN